MYSCSQPNKGFASFTVESNSARSLARAFVGCGAPDGVSTSHSNSRLLPPRMGSGQLKTGLHVRTWEERTRHCDGRRRIPLAGSPQYAVAVAALRLARAAAVEVPLGKRAADTNCVWQDACLGAQRVEQRRLGRGNDAPSQRTGVCRRVSAAASPGGAAAPTLLGTRQFKRACAKCAKTHRFRAVRPYIFHALRGGTRNARAARASAADTPAAARLQPHAASRARKHRAKCAGREDKVMGAGPCTRKRTVGGGASKLRQAS